MSELGDKIPKGDADAYQMSRDNWKCPAREPKVPGALAKVFVFLFALIMTSRQRMGGETLRMGRGLSCEERHHQDSEKETTTNQTTSSNLNYKLNERPLEFALHDVPFAPNRLGSPPYSLVLLSRRQSLRAEEGGRDRDG